MVGRIGRWFGVVGVIAGLAWQARAADADRPPGILWQAATGETASRLPKGYHPLPSLGALIEHLAPAVVGLACVQQCPPGSGVEPGWVADGWAPGIGPDPREDPERGLRGRTLGSGFILNPDGLIVTNAHVIRGQDQVEVRLADGRRLRATVLGADPESDLALLEVDSPGALPAVVLGDSTGLRVGDWVLAMGNPLGAAPRASAGIVSGGASPAGPGSGVGLLQTDAAIVPAISGGPLFDNRGAVVGINTAAAGQPGVGLVIPVDLAKQVLPRLRAHGRVRRGWLGVGVQELTAELAAEFKVPAGQGVLVSQVYPDSPARRAGLAAGDVLFQLDAEPVADARDLTRRIGALPPGTRVRLQVRRAGAVKTFKVRLQERSAPPPPPPPPPGPGGRAERLGLQLAPLTPERARRMGLAADLRGLAVVGVDPGGPAAGILKAGDLILEANRVPVADLDDFSKAAATEPDRILLRIQRGQAQVYLVFTDPRSVAGPGAR